MEELVPELVELILDYVSNDFILRPLSAPWYHVRRSEQLKWNARVMQGRGRLGWVVCRHVCRLWNRLVLKHFPLAKLRDFACYDLCAQVHISALSANCHMSLYLCCWLLVVGCWLVLLLVWCVWISGGCSWLVVSAPVASCQWMAMGRKNGD